MGKRKRTPTKRALTKHVKRSRGRPRKERPKLTVKRCPDTPLSNADRMTIVLLANAGKTPSDISSIVGCTYRVAVNTLIVQNLVFTFGVRNGGVSGKKKFCEQDLLLPSQKAAELLFSTRRKNRNGFTKS